MDAQKEPKSYVIWVEFDDNSSRLLEEVCTIFTENNIDLGIMPPHMTLTFVKCSDEEILKGIVTDFFKDRTIPDLPIVAVSSFPVNVVFYSPQITTGLLNVHNDLCSELLSIGELHWNLYTPENWTPHIALTGSLPADKALQAFEIMMGKLKDNVFHPSNIVIRCGKEDVFKLEL